MKKSLIALAALASFAGVASAQSSVTLFGIVDATIAYGHGSVANKTQLTNSGYNSSRLGFRGVEDLGGGLSASFWLEAGVNNDNGSGTAPNVNNQPTGGTLAGLNGGQGLTFNRRSTVSLAGNWGELRLGRDYTPQFWNLTIFDPFGTNGVGTTQTLNGTSAAGIITGQAAIRASNSIGYFLPGNIGGFYGQAQYYLGENLSNSTNAAGQGNKNDGTGYGLRVGYANGPFNVALALSKTEYAAGDAKQNNIAGQWDFGVAKLQGQYVWDELGNAKGKGWLLGGLVPVGPGEIRGSYSEYKVDTAGNPKSRKFALGYVHNLSKRTALYATWAKVNNDGPATSAVNNAVTAAGQSSYGYDFGVRHSF